MNNSVEVKTIDALSVGRFLYERNACDYGAAPDQLEQMWEDPGVRLFWTQEAEAVLGFIGFVGVR